MSIKDALKVFPWDKLSHYQWASWFAAFMCAASLPITMLSLHKSMSISASVAAAVSLVAAAMAGAGGEMMDRMANDKVANENALRRQQGLPEELPLSHSVSEGDFWASALGCLPSAVPMLVFAIIARNLGL